MKIKTSHQNKETKRGCSHGGCHIECISGKIVSKCHKVTVENSSGGTSNAVVENFDQLLKNPDDLILHVGTNELTNNLKLLNNVKKIVKKSFHRSPSSIIVRKDKQKLDKSLSETTSTGANDRGFYLIFNKRFDHLERLLTIRRPKKAVSAGSLYGPFVPSPQSKCSKRTFILPQKYHALVSNMVS